MLFSKYNLTLKKLEENEIEILRTWRNDPRVLKFMLSNNSYISKEEQKQWFNSIKNSQNSFYYMIYKDDLLLGYSAIKNIDYKTKIGEPGGIIKELILACLKAFITYDFYFDELGILATYAYIKNSNTKSHNYAKSLGYKQDKSKNNGDFYYYTLNKDDYIAKRDRYLSILGVYLYLKLNNF